MTTLEALAIRINDTALGDVEITPEQLEHIVRALALDEDARILFFGQVAERQVEAESD